MTKRLLRFLPALCLCFSLPASANWVASGTFLYEDRDWDSSGFTGTTVNKPIRWADVEVFDTAKSGTKSVIGKGRTNANGAFSINVTDSSTRTVKVRVLTRTTATSDLFVKVTNLGGTVYAGNSGSVSSHNPNANVNFGTMVARAFTGGGEAFNILDLGIYGADYVKTLTGARPSSSRLVTVRWQINGGITGSTTSGNTVTLRDTAGYDDTVILHEWSHYVMYNYSASSNPGATHALSDCRQDIRLAFDEGRATFFGNAVIRYFGWPHPHVYVRTSGTTGTGGATNWFNLEDEEQYACDGQSSEVTVSRSLWDIGDGAGTNDLSIGLDEPFDTMSLADVECWQVFTGPVKSSKSVSLETFWDGWFDPTVSNGYLTSMRNVFGQLSIEFVPDGLESNDTVSTANPVSVNDPARHLTLFADPDGNGKGQADTDIVSFGGANGTSYTIQTTNLFNGANTKVEVLDTNGSTVLASNDDRAAGDPSSLVSWRATKTGTFYVRVTDTASAGDYGSYDLSLTSP